MKKTMCVILAAMLALLTFAGCKTEPKNEENVSAVSDTTVPSVSDADEEKPDKMAIFNYEIKDPEPIDAAENVERMFFFRDEMKMFGKIYYPEGDGPFPAVILTSGLRAPCSSVGDIAQCCAENGIAAVVYDPTCAVIGSRSDGDPRDLSSLTESADLCAVMDAVCALEKIDDRNIFLWGHSFGGEVSTFVAARRPDEVKALVLVEPAFQLRDICDKTFPEGTDIPDTFTDPLTGGQTFKAFYEDELAFDIYELIPEYKGNVLMFGGTVKGSAIGADMPEYLDRAAEKFPAVRYEIIEGADHAFSSPDMRRTLMDMTVDFIKENIG